MGNRIGFIFVLALAFAATACAPKFPSQPKSQISSAPESATASSSQAETPSRQAIVPFTVVGDESTPGEVKRAPHPASAILKEMGAIIEMSLQRHDTYEPIFFGSVDWHSAVHGHWALFRITRATGDPQFAEFANRSLDPALLAREQEQLQYFVGFERPYGRSWFLLLASEFQKWAIENGVSDPERLKPMAEMIAAGLLEYFEGEDRALDPKLVEYDNPCWSLLRLHDYFRFTGDSASLARTERLVEKVIERGRGLNFEPDYVSGKYFSLKANWLSLFAAVQPARFSEYVALNPVLKGQLRVPRTAKPEERRAGLLWSRAWNFKALSRVAVSDEQKAILRAAQASHVEAALEIHSRMKDDLLYFHWIPQFATYALTQGDLD